MRNLCILMVFLVCSSLVIAQAEEEKIVASDAAGGDQFGRSVSLSGDTAVVGARYDYVTSTDQGSAYVFTRNSAGSWIQQAKLIASDPASWDRFGTSVSIYGDTVLVGANGDDDGGDSSGSAYVFTRAGGSWSQQAKLRASDADTLDSFGCSVSVDVDTAAIGAWANSDAGTYSGSAYVFTRSGGSWTEQTKLTASDGADRDYFGYSVSVDGDTVVVGAYGDDDSGTSSGSAYVFIRVGSVWTEQAKLTASDGAAYDNFGMFVSVTDDTVVVGAYGHNDYAGSAYVFTRAGGIWTEEAKLTAADARSDAYFGSSVSISEDTVMVGAECNYYVGNDNGSAYLFTRGPGGSWAERAKLTASDGAADDWFGYSVSVDSDIALVGAYGDDDAGSETGSAYVYAFCGQAVTLVADQWRLISLPCSMSSSVEELFGDDDLGTYDTDWAIVERLEDSDSYRVLLTTDVIEQGVGYWIKVLDGSPEIDVFGEPTDESTDFEVALVEDGDPGRWNLIGNPFDSDVFWSDVKVVDTATSYEYAISDATSGDYLTNRTMYVWNGTSYQSFHPVSNPGSVATFEGFWVRVKAPSSLLFPPPAAKKADPASGKRQTPDGWWLQLSASSAEYSDPGNRLGRMTVSLDEADEYDLQELEPFASPYLTLVFPHPEWQTGWWSHTTDFRELRPGAGGTWDFEVRSNVPRDVVLTWHGLDGALPELLSRSVLVDVESSQSIAPQAGGSYAFTMISTTHRLRWQINATPQLDAGADRQSYLGRLLTVSLPFSDEDADDNHTAAVDWGDGAIEAATVDASARQVSASHQFMAIGTYEIEICVRDNAGAESCDTFAAMVDESPPGIFQDGFESGGTFQWSVAVGL